jgi:hypothetical protein
VDRAEGALRKFKKSSNIAKMKEKILAQIALNQYLELILASGIRNHH